jgi:hypothetical protein
LPLTVLIVNIFCPRDHLYGHDHADFALHFPKYSSAA